MPTPPCGLILLVVRLRRVFSERGQKHRFPPAVVEPAIQPRCDRLQPGQVTPALALGGYVLAPKLAAFLLILAQPVDDDKASRMEIK